MLFICSPAGSSRTSSTSVRWSLPEKARATAQKGVEIDPADIQFRHNLARSNYRVAVAAANLKRSDEALDTLKIAGDAVPCSDRARRETGSTAGPWPYFTRGLDLHAACRNDLAGSNADFVRSLELWQQVAESDPGNKNARRDIALRTGTLPRTFSKLGEKAKAREHFPTAVDDANGLKSEVAPRS
ncbi:MAG: hypothetical protein IPM21_12100 [Acidobacteria bacterium]|nr:hypothetical protein [Acidobacteriota bacterium]